jgi:hypothetical protein
MKEELGDRIRIDPEEKVLELMKLSEPITDDVDGESGDESSGSTHTGSMISSSSNTEKFSSAKSQLDKLIEAAN